MASSSTTTAPRRSDDAILDASLADSRTGAASFSRFNRAYRLAWTISWLLLAAWTPPPLRRWRCLLLRWFGASVHPTANVYASARIWSPANLTMGRYACIGPRATVYSMGPIAIEEYAILSQGVHLCAGTHDPDDPNFQLAGRPIVIGRHAWIAAEAFVGPGVSVGEGAVLGARACAMRSLDAWTIYSGNPAVALRERRRQATAVE